MCCINGTIRCNNNITPSIVAMFDWLSRQPAYASVQQGPVESTGQAPQFGSVRIRFACQALS